MLLKSFNGLTQQMFEKPFKDMLFGIYNFAEEEFYIHGLKNLGYDGDIDSLEFIALDRNNCTNNEIKLFKQYVEEDLQKSRVVIGVLLFKGKKEIVPIVVKPKSVRIEDFLKEK